MGTRSLTVMQEEDGTEIAVLYRQMDGYPTGHGKDLADFLHGRVIVNGYSSDTPERAFNGASCMAAQIVSHFKGEEVGSFYLRPAGTRDTGEEYIYEVRPKNERIHLRVIDCHCNHTLYSGLLDNFVPEDTE